MFKELFFKPRRLLNKAKNYGNVRQAIVYNIM
jgi:hypothetical protein